MVLRLNIDRIELATRDWICKIQIVEIGRPRESLDKKCRFQIFILEDEEECQIKVVLYADEIEQYADKLKLMNTYLISTTKVKVSLTSYGKPLHKFYWVLDKETVIEHIKPSNELEKPLPPPSKLNMTTFDRIPHMMVDSAAEIDILAIIVRCSPQKYAGRTHRKCREITICDNYCVFQIDLTDGTATTTTSISGELGEKLLSMTAEDIFHITCAKRQSLSLNHVHQMLSNKQFEIELRKSSCGSSNNTHATFSILSYMENEHTPQSTTDRNSKKIRPLQISEVEVMATTTTAGSSNVTPKFEPPTPTKMV
ncbi:hypothetical protein KY289_013521 [Solanum tuberosum]|nr:hypothetical protein KY289_013521 [Solanum tuberosum]